MAFELTPEELQNISVKCVTQFMSKQASLSNAICKQAMDLELNPEQIKRVIETTNTLAFLRQREDAPDKSFEFPVADYKEVMASMVIPDNEIQAATTVAPGNQLNGQMEMQDESAPFATTSEQEKMAMIGRETLRCKAVLTKMAYDKVGLQLELENAIKSVRQDELALEKLAHITTEDDFYTMAALCGLEQRSLQGVILTDAELRNVDHAYALYKEASSLLKKEKELIQTVNQAENLLLKQAGLGEWAGKQVGSLVRNVAAAGANSVTGPIKRLGSFSSAAKKKGFSNVGDAVKHFDRMKSTHGPDAAKAFFNGQAPSMTGRVVRGVGLAGAFGGAVGIAQQSGNKDDKVWDSLHGGE